MNKKVTFIWITAIIIFLTIGISGFIYNIYINKIMNEVNLSTPLDKSENAAYKKCSINYSKSAIIYNFEIIDNKIEKIYLFYSHINSDKNINLIFENLIKENIKSINLQQRKEKYITQYTMVIDSNKISRYMEEKWYKDLEKTGIRLYDVNDLNSFKDDLKKEFNNIKCE